MGGLVRRAWRLCGRALRTAGVAFSDPWSLLPPLPHRPRSRFRPALEGLEGRLVPTAGSYAWTDGTNDNLASDGANWTNTVTHTTGHVPTSADYVFYGSGNGGANKPCTVNLNLVVDRVEMDSTYTATLTVLGGDKIQTANQFDQFGALVLDGSASVSVGGNVTINGNVATAPGMIPPVGHISTSASFYIEPGSTIVADAGAPGAGLVLSAGAFDDAGLISAGTATTPGDVTVSGSLVEDSTGVLDVFPASMLTINTGGNSGAVADLKGALSVVGTGTAAAAVANAQTLWVDGGSLVSTGGPGGTGNTISGGVSVYNNGSMVVGSGTAAATLSMTAGSLTVGAQAPGLTGTGGTLTLSTDAVLNFPAAAGASTFVVEGGSQPGVLNMDGADIVMAVARVASLDLEGGVLNSNNGAIGGMAFLDTVTGDLNNAGTVDFGSALHTLTVTGAYTQTSAGTLDERLDNGNPPALSPSDVLAIGSAASLAGAYNLTGLHTLSPNQTWQPITYGTNPGPSQFDSFNPPDDGNPWAIAYLAGVVQVTN